MRAGHGGRRPTAAAEVLRFSFPCPFHTFGAAVVVSGKRVYPLLTAEMHEQSAGTEALQDAGGMLCPRRGAVRL